MVDVVSEKIRRRDLWRAISKERMDDVEPARLRKLGIYGGAQGIWVDKARTASPDTGADGVTVAILHTGRHYADDLSDDGVIYHYPKTSRPPARDAAEIQATSLGHTLSDHHGEWCCYCLDYIRDGDRDRFARRAETPERLAALTGSSNVCRMGTFS